MADVEFKPEADAQQYSSPSGPGSNQSVKRDSAVSTLLQQTKILQNQSQSRQGNISVFVNGGAAPKKKDSVSVPDKLPEVEATAYANGQPFQTTMVVLDNKHLLQRAAGYDFFLMRYAALREARITLKLNSAFRTMEEQKAIYAERQLHPKKGPAAEPGFSNHQQGLSVDIQTDISFENWKSGRVLTSPVHTWLVQNAHRFGFDQRDLGTLADGRKYEPWHWTHANDEKIYGLDDVANELTDLYAEALDAGNQAAFNADGSPDIFRLMMKLGYDTARSSERSVAASTALRQKIFDASAAYCAQQGPELARRSAALGMPINLEPPAGFGSAPPLYNFETGRWSDGGEYDVGV